MEAFYESNTPCLAEPVTRVACRIDSVFSLQQAVWQWVMLTHRNTVSTHLLSDAECSALRAWFRDDRTFDYDVIPVDCPPSLKRIGITGMHDMVVGIRTSDGWDHEEAGRVVDWLNTVEPLLREWENMCVNELLRRVATRYTSLAHFLGRIEGRLGKRPSSFTGTTASMFPVRSVFQASVQTQSRVVWMVQ
jgi:cellulose biosynthesis protein BcsQ